MTSPRPVRNIALIAHVDHGKTTLVGKLLHQAGVFAAHPQVQERVMDTNERERGITILAKNPGRLPGRAHQHRGCARSPGFRRRSGAGALHGGWSATPVDTVEGPMPQTRFVTRKALCLGLKPIVVVNKVDRMGARPDWVVNRTFELFDPLGASEEQLDFPVVYASALQGWANARCAETRFPPKA